MIRHLLTFFLFSTLLLAQARPYIGLSTGWITENFEFQIEDAENKKLENVASNIHSLKLGYGDIQSFAIVLNLSFTDFNENIFSKDDGALYNFNVEVMKSFNLDINFYPTIKVGMGAGRMNVDRKIENYIEKGTFNAGIGFMYRLSYDIDLEYSIDYYWSHWTTVDLIALTPETTSRALQSTIGLNFRY